MPSWSVSTSNPRASAIISNAISTGWDSPRIWEIIVMWLRTTLASRLEAACGIFALREK